MLDGQAVLQSLISAILAGRGIVKCSARRILNPKPRQQNVVGCTSRRRSALRMLLRSHAWCTLYCMHGHTICSAESTIPLCTR